MNLSAWTAWTDDGQNRCKNLSASIRLELHNRLMDLKVPSDADYPVTVEFLDLIYFIRENCVLSGGAISSLAHREKYSDLDLYFKSKQAIDEFLQKWVSYDYSYVPANENSLYSWKKSTGPSEEESNYSNLVEVDGKVSTKNAVTLPNRLQFIVCGTFDELRPKFDYVHCMPYYDLSTDKMLMSLAQFDAIEKKKLVINNHLASTDARREKYLKRGWVFVTPIV